MVIFRWVASRWDTRTISKSPPENTPNEDRHPSHRLSLYACITASISIYPTPTLTPFHPTHHEGKALSTIHQLTPPNTSTTTSVFQSPNIQLNRLSSPYRQHLCRIPRITPQHQIQYDSQYISDLIHPIIFSIIQYNPNQLTSDHSTTTTEDHRTELLKPIERTMTRSLYRFTHLHTSYL